MDKNIVSLHINYLLLDTPTAMSLQNIPMTQFNLQSSYVPAWDQWDAIKQIVDGFNSGQKAITLLGATGTGKTFTMANVIAQLGKPTLVLSHNKTLAAQLATEFKHFFPSNAVHYFVSYFDYYQPESYLADKDVYIEKEATVNAEIEMYRLSTMASLLTRPDTVVVSSVSALYGLWEKQNWENSTLILVAGQRYPFKELKAKLISMQYKPVTQSIESGMFDVRGEMVDIFASTEKVVYRCYFNEDYLEYIETKDADTFASLGQLDRVVIWPKSQYLQDMSDIDNILVRIEAEMEDRVAEFERRGEMLEAQRLKKRVLYDIRMIKETGFVNGIENYSIYFDGREPGQPPTTIFDYFPDDMLVIVDESHLWIGQLAAMPSADHSRKVALVEHGFRLPSAFDHRPLGFEELQLKLGRKEAESWKEVAKEEKRQQKAKISSEKSSGQIFWSSSDHLKKWCQTLFVSATPAKYELEHSDQVVQQIIRPTGLLDPITMVYPKSWDYNLLLSQTQKVLNKKPHLREFMDWYITDIKHLKDVFEWGEHVEN